MPAGKDLFILAPYVSLASVEVVRLSRRLTTDWIVHLMI